MEAGSSIRRHGVELSLSRLDVAGAFGDIGVLFPIAIALISLCQMNPTAVFLAAGLAYILAGAYFQIPISVQPFKAVAALALALQLPPPAIVGAGFLMGVLLVLIGITNIVSPLAKLFSLPIIRGIQLGLGLILAREGLRLALGSKSAMIFPGGWLAPGWTLALAGGLLLLACQRSRRFPAALVLLAVGVLVGLLAQWKQLHVEGWGPVPLQVLVPRAEQLKQVLVTLVLPQFALTFGNSIVATENTARLLYGSQAHRVTPKALSLSIGVMNLFSSFLGGAPMCHGSGGVTAHYKFGARTPKSSYVMGGVCLCLALFGSAAVGLLHLIPAAVLAVFLMYVGVQHAFLVRDILASRASLFIAICVGLVSLAATNLTYGFLAGFLVQVLLLIFGKTRLKTEVALSKET